MIFQCFLPANRTFGRFIPPGDVKSNTFQKRSLKQQIASNACPSTANFQWYLIASCHPFFNLFALRIQRCSKPWSISSCDLYFWKAACHVFNASTPLWCSCFPFLNLFFHILRHLQLVKRPTASIKHSWPQQQIISPCLPMNPFQVMEISYFLKHVKTSLLGGDWSLELISKDVKCLHLENIIWEWFILRW